MDSSQLFFGLLYMYEYEVFMDVFEVLEEWSVNVYLYDYCLSIYLFGGFQVMEIFNINYVIYFQFNLVDFGDFWIFFEISLIFKISEKLVFWIYFQLMYDECLLIFVFNIMYSFSNGLEIVF